MTRLLALIPSVILLVSCETLDPLRGVIGVAKEDRIRIIFEYNPQCTAGNYWNSWYQPIRFNED